MNFFQELDIDEEWNQMLNLTETYKTDGNSTSMERFMKEHATRVKHSFQQALQQVLDGFMEGGSRLKLLLCIMRNCLESNVPESSKAQFMFDCAFVEELPQSLTKLSENRGNSETWYLSCFLDVVELLSLCLFLSENILFEKLAHQLVVCLIPLEKCLHFQDKQHKLKTIVFKTLLKLLELIEQYDVVDKTSSEYQHVMEGLLATKLLPKKSPLFPVMYDVLIKLLMLNQGLTTPFTLQISSGSDQWLLESLVADLRQQQNLSAVLFLLSSSLHNKVVLRHVTDSFHNMSSLLGLADNDVMKERVLRFLLNVLVYAVTLESIK